MKASERTLNIIRGALTIFRLRPETETVFFDRRSPGQRPNFQFQESTIASDFEMVGRDLNEALRIYSRKDNEQETAVAPVQSKYFIHQSRSRLKNTAESGIANSRF